MNENKNSEELYLEQLMPADEIIRRRAILALLRGFVAEEGAR